MSEQQPPPAQGPIVVPGTEILEQRSPQISVQPLTAPSDQPMSPNQQPPPAQGAIVVPGTQIVKTRSPNLLVQGLPPIQLAALLILLFLGIFSTLALIPIMGVWYTHVPAAPSLEITASNAGVISDTLTIYQRAGAIAAEQPLNWFDVLFIKILYPLVTLMLGYLFGAQQLSASKTT